MIGEMIDMSDEFTKEGIQLLTKGQVLGFKLPNGAMRYYKIVRLNKSKRIVKVEETLLYEPDEIAIVDAE